MALTDRASLLRALFRLLDVDRQDPALTEHDDDELEGAYLLLDQGLWDAQDFMISQGLADRWVKTVDFPNWGSGADSDWQSDPHTDSEYAALPDDLLRIAGGQHRSALHEDDGTEWGRLVPWSARHEVRGDAYWLQNENLWIADGASPPSDLKLDYHHRLAELADGTTVDFPKEDRSLIVACAADLAVGEAWVPNRQDVRNRVQRNLTRKKRRAIKRARRSREPHRLRSGESPGTHHFGSRRRRSY